MTPLAAARAHLHAFNARDLDSVSAGFADDAVFATGDDLVVGRRGITAFFAEAFSQPLRAELELRRGLQQGETAACELAERLTLDDGRAHELALAAFYTVRGGLLVRVKVYREDAATLDAGAWSPTSA